MALLVGAIVIVAMFGVIFAWRGWRGAAVDDHPLCRRCGYDLYGRPSDAADTCPECGADLSAPRSRVMGHRQHRRPSLVSGILLLLIAATVGGMLGTPAIRGYNWDRIKPAWLLLREARGGRGGRTALLELIDRLNHSKLSQRQIEQIADEALAQQADAARTWNPQWGDFIVAARSRELLSDQRWRRYANQSLDFAIPATASISERDLLFNVLHATVSYSPTRGAAVTPDRKTWLHLQTTIRASGDLLADKQYASEIEHPLQLSGGTVKQDYRAALDPRKIAAATTTQHQIRVTIEAIVSDIPDYSLQESREPGKHPPLIKRTIILTAPWRLVLAAARPTTRPMTTTGPAPAAHSSGHVVNRYSLPPAGATPSDVAPPTSRISPSLKP